MENSLTVIFDEIWPKAMYYSPWSLAQFLSKFKKSNFDLNQFKVSTQHKKMYAHEIMLHELHWSLVSACTYVPPQNSTE